MPRHVPGGEGLSIADDAVDVWLAFDAQFAEPAVQAKWFALLMPQDVARRQLLFSEELKRQFVLTRALQRLVLSEYAPEIDPAQWQFQASTEGRPSLAPPFDRTGLHFNLAHSDGVVAMAVCRHARVGIDIEKRGRARLNLAERYFSAAEAAQLRECPSEGQPLRFVRLWTLKEAYLKAMGKGLAGGLGRTSFVFDQAGEFRFERADDADAARWQFSQYEIGAEHVLGLAVLPDADAGRLAVTVRALGQEERAQP